MQIKQRAFVPSVFTDLGLPLDSQMATRVTLKGRARRENLSEGQTEMSEGGVMPAAVRFQCSVCQRKWECQGNLVCI